MKLRKLVLTGLALALLAPFTALAQDGGEGGGQGQGNRGGILREILPPPGYLQLTDEQKDSTRALAEELRAALEPLRAERQDLAEQLRDELDADDPDPTAIGQLILDQRDVGGAIRDELATFEEAFRDLLDDEQTTKWDNFRELRQLQRRRAERAGAKALRGPGR